MASRLLDPDTLVELEGVNGEWFDLTNGTEGIYLATEVTGLLDPPVKATYEEPGNFPGARYLNHRVLRRDLVFGVEILNDENDETWLRRDSAWRKAWSFKRDAKLHITTGESGHRYLKVRLFESPTTDMVTDPRGREVNITKMVVVAGDPFWYEDDVVYPIEVQEDTTFDPNPLPWPWPQPELPVEDIEITVPNANPTDNIIWPKWTLPGSSEKPAEPYIPGLPWLGAPKSPATLWTVPDYKLDLDEDEDPSLGTRRIRMPGQIGGLRVEEVQQIYIDGRPTGGTFKIGYGDEWTEPIAYNASPNDVRAALIALEGISANDVEVSLGGATNEVQTVRLKGGALGGTFTLSLGSETTVGIPFNASDADLQGALVGLDSIGSADVRVKSTKINEVQVVELVGEPTSGSFTLTLDGQTTAPIAYNATPATVAARIADLPNIDGNYVKVEGLNEWFHSPYRITFGEAQSQGVITDIISGIIDFIGGLFGGNASGKGVGGIDIDEMTGDVGTLSGGAGLDVQVTTEQDGDRLYVVSFQRAAGGLNLPQLVGNASGLEGDDLSIETATNVDGGRPYVVRFTDDLQGVDVPTMTVDTDDLTGGYEVGSRVVVLREGYTYPAENVVVDSDPREEQVSSESGSPIWERMNSVRFLHYIPPYTGEVTFKLSVSGAVPGQIATLRLPRAWSRPWGLE
ncbi:minor tail protein [Mycobacterium phage Bxb1]|uniref:Minor tail protein n=1 Tax=Mycobacterium phage Bxb1 TaxID=2902907 RepID=Q9B098_BPMB1|nr:minor tail protein [Mycobacterium phage Bxb1]AAG59728.1 minor tail protein [Mycobacterium phage Bxb1]